MRCVVVGLGGISQAMLRHLQQKSWYETAAAVDVRPEALQQSSEALGLSGDQLFTSLETALGSVDADSVIINTPSELHFRQAQTALAAGRHVLVAKPITNSYEEAVELVSLAAQMGVTLSVGQQMRYRRHYEAVGRFIASGQIGTVEMMNFVNTKPRHKALNLKGMSHPALYEMSCHHFDSMLALIPGRIPERIICDGFQPSWSVYDGPCMVNALITFSDNLHLLYQGGFSSQADSYELRIEGTDGVIRCRGIHMSNDTMVYEFAPRGQSFTEVVIDNDIPGGDPWGRFFDIWFDFVNGGQEPPFSGRNNLQVFALLSAGIDSIESGRSTSVLVADNPRFTEAFHPASTA